MERVTLTEYRTVKAVPLSVRQRDGLRDVAPSITITPTVGNEGCYDLTPGGHVGAVCLPGMAIEIKPKIAIDRLLFLVSYALDPKRWRPDVFGFGQESSLLEAVIPGFVAQVQRAFRRGVLQGYRTDEAALATVRGRIMFDQQLRARHGLFPPIEVRYDEFTEDIECNRLIKAAIRRLGFLHVRSSDARRSLRSFDTLLGAVSLVEYDRRRLPTIHYDRLNQHYRSAVDLSELILRSVSFELSHGEVQSAAFLLDMNEVFENFVVVGLREALSLSQRAFPQGASGRWLRLDQAGMITLRPDLSWWDSHRCSFVGDAKYKRIEATGILHPDLYQLLAYSVGADLPGGLLVYAAAESDAVIHDVVHVGKELHVMPIDLSGPPDAILAQISKVAKRVRMLRVAAMPPGD